MGIIIFKMTSIELLPATGVISGLTL